MGGRGEGNALEGCESCQHGIFEDTVNKVATVDNQYSPLSLTVASLGTEAGRALLSACRYTQIPTNLSSF
jgi:hypothetical protein